MRIDAYNQIASIYKMNQPKKTGGASKSERGNDIVEISSAAKSFQSVRAKMAEAPEIREEKVAKLKAMVEAGTYSVSGRMIAEKLVEGYFKA